MSEKLNKKGLERLWHKILLLADCIYGKISALEKSMPEQAKNGKLTIQKNGTTVETFTANQSGDTTANIIIPNVINSCAVTQKGQMALDAIEKNATIEGTLAHQIAQANSNLSQNANGKFVLPNGLKICWGHMGYATDLTASFPFVFNSDPCVVACLNYVKVDGLMAAIRVYDVTTTGFKVVDQYILNGILTDCPQSQGINWIAIGY